MSDENGGDRPVNLVDGDLPKGFFAMFCLDSFYLERTAPVSKGICSLVVVSLVDVHFRFPLE